MATQTMKTPNFFFDTDHLMAAQQRNVDALTSASQIMVDSYKAIALRQSEMLKSSMGDFVKVGQQAANGKAGEFQPGDQLSRAKTSYEAAMSNAREITEMAVKAQSEAFNVLTKCFMTNVDEFKTLTKSA